MRWVLGLVLLAGCDRLLGLQQIGGGDADIPPPPGTWQSVASGGDHSCAIRLDGTLWCWGSNTSGALGLGSAVAQEGEPTQVGSAAWTAVSTHAGQNAYVQTRLTGGGGGTTLQVPGETTCGIQSDGSLWCWGGNAQGSVGNGGVADQYDPVQIGLGQTWSAIAVGGSHACAIDAASAMWCWGQGTYGQLGTGGLNQQLVPVRVTSSVAWTAVTAGDDFTCGLASDGIGWCWGNDWAGQLGDGKYSPEYTPSQIDNEVWTSLAAGAAHVCAVREDGHLRCWGDNGAGELGNGESYNTFSPIAPDDDTDGWVAVTAGTSYTCASRSDGHLLCWGDNSNGQLGNTTTSRFNATPTVVRHGAASWTQVAGGRDHTCGIGADHNLWCFGLAELGTSGDVHAPAQVAGAWKTVSAGQSSTCAITDRGALACWGENTAGQIGDSTTIRRTSPKTIADPPWTAVSVGTASACALHDGGELYCWGTSVSGLGDGSIGRLAPTKVGGGPWAMVATDSDHTCAVDTTHRLYCWGYNGNYELGTGDSTVYTTPQPIPGSTWDAVTTAGSNVGAHTCAVAGTQVLCWGANFSYQVDGTGLTVISPMAVTTSVHVAAGEQYSCAIDGSGAASCWGYNATGQLGLGSTSIYAVTPMPVMGGGSWLSLASGYTHTCGIMMDHSLWCWGDDARGQLGDDNNVMEIAPVRVGNAADWQEVTAGGTHTCALETGGSLWCWGDNTSGQLGLGTSSEGTPVLVP